MPDTSKKYELIKMDDGTPRFRVKALRDISRSGSDLVAVGTICATTNAGSDRRAHLAQPRPSPSRSNL